MKADVLIDFIMRLLKDAKRKVYLILDNLRVHYAKPVKEWLEKHKRIIQVFYLAAYSPELNPDEYSSGDLKAGVHSGKPARNKKTTEAEDVETHAYAAAQTGPYQKIFSARKIFLCRIENVFNCRVNMMTSITRILEKMQVVQLDA